MGFGAYIAGKLLKWGGWTVNVGLPDFDKCVICVAPHTSNWDFITSTVPTRMSSFWKSSKATFSLMGLAR